MNNANLIKIIIFYNDIYLNYIIILNLYLDKYKKSIYLILLWRILSLVCLYLVSIYLKNIFV
jgi:hypothetical protein